MLRYRRENSHIGRYWEYKYEEAISDFVDEISKDIKDLASEMGQYIVDETDILKSITTLTYMLDVMTHESFYGAMIETKGKIDKLKIKYCGSSHYELERRYNYMQIGRRRNNLRRNQEYRNKLAKIKCKDLSKPIKGTIKSGKIETSKPKTTIGGKLIVYEK